ncbi:hypothetical protein [Rariglobus hedericola]|uniref:DUF2993 domain-containing protein n=1 Tax=Rariglobus hedericola TaxID=2597822 RepID=A0A556QQ07_9BACT|nr:hypothetical protein [Rariglobus hedericola]TSJ78726.1 hypothetical protein FPL22_05310 [Rariglobus hedericola]
MASNKKIDRALNGPGMFEITLGVLLSLTLGVLLAALHLIFKPVEIVDKPVEAPERGQVYFVEGSSNTSKARQGTRKRQMLAEGNSADVSFNEEELNAWMASATQQPQAGSAGASELFTPERVNFRIREGVLHVGLLGKLKAVGLNQDLVFQTSGTFAQGADGYEFVADELYIGSLPTHIVPGLTPMLMKRILAAQELPEDLRIMWKKLKLVAVEDNSLRLVLP